MVIFNGSSMSGNTHKDQKIRIFALMVGYTAMTAHYLLYCIIPYMPTLKILAYLKSKPPVKPRTMSA